MARRITRTHRRRGAEKSLESIRNLVSDLERLPPALGQKWKVGMLRYWRSVLEELEELEVARHDAQPPRQ